MSRILILGNGYLADNLSYFLSSKYNVTVFARTKNAEHYNVNYIYDSIDNLKDLENIYDYIFILFGHSRPTMQASLSDVIYTNVVLTSKVLEFAIKNKSKIFYPATSLSLDDSKMLNYYVYSHTTVIDLIKKFHSVTNLPYTICYLHNIYGNLTNTIKKNKMIVDVLIDCFQNNKQITLYNNGSQKRFFTHIYDVVSYMESDIKSNLIKEINLVNRNTLYSVSELATFLNLKSINVDCNLYSTSDPSSKEIDKIMNWEETIDIKHWLNNNL